jgi:DNA-binding CsgD family transcriptional regulator
METAPLNGQMFSRRQTEILRRIAAGETDKEIAQGLGISRKTVESHLGRLYRRGQFRGRAHAVVSWLQTQSLTTASP